VKLHDSMKDTFQQLFIQGSQNNGANFQLIWQANFNVVQSLWWITQTAAERPSKGTGIPLKLLFCNYHKLHHTCNKLLRLQHHPTTTCLL